jgi:hypothetical protein
MWARGREHGPVSGTTEGASVGSDARSRQGEEKGGDKNGWRCGGRAAGGSLRNGRRAAKCKNATKSEFRLLGSGIFWNAGVLQKKNESNYCNGGTSLDAKK